MRERDACMRDEEGGRGNRGGGPDLTKLVLKKIHETSLVLSHLYLGSHGYTVQGVDVRFTARSTEKELGQRRLLVLW